jgi:SAM-dependent methyltransferase
MIRLEQPMEYEDAVERLVDARRMLGRIPNGFVAGRRCLDVGCGTGNMLLALKEMGAKECLGLDIDLKDFGETWFDRIAADHGIDTSCIAFIENELQEENLDSESCDLVTLLDVMEHAARPRELLQEVFRILRPGGVVLIDVPTLYYSQVGHHLWPYFPRNARPWIHLWKTFPKNNDRELIDPWSWAHFIALNKITHSTLMRHIKDAGFVILDNRTAETGEGDYPTYKEKIDHDAVPLLEDLFIEIDYYSLTKGTGGRAIKITWPEGPAPQEPQAVLKDSSGESAPTPPSGLPCDSPGGEDEQESLAEKLRQLETLADPSIVPETTRLRPLKRMINRAIRCYSAGQTKFNRELIKVLADILRKLD